MRRLLRWMLRGSLALAALALIAYGVVYALSERAMRRVYREPLVNPVLPTDSGAIAEGRRLARLRGCSGGCHGTEIEGAVFMDEPLLARIVAPNLTAAARRYSDAELARIIRRGVRPDGHSLVVMPSEMFSALSDADLGKILAYLHSIPPRPGPGAEVRLGPLARLGLVLGKYHTAAELVHRADSVAASYPAVVDSTGVGAYLARTVCTECHGLDLRGGERAPDLRIAAAYSPEAFTRLLRTGKASGARELQLMSRVARSRFAHFSDAEIRMLYDYLLTRARTVESSLTRGGGTWRLETAHGAERSSSARSRSLAGGDPQAGTRQRQIRYTGMPRATIKRPGQV